MNLKSRREDMYTNTIQNRDEYEKCYKQVDCSLDDVPGGSDGKAGDLGPIAGAGRSPGEGNGTPLQYYCLENGMDRGAWQATVHGVAKSRTRLSDFTFLSFPFLSFR